MHRLTEERRALQDLIRVRAQQLVGDMPLTGPGHGGDNAEKYQREPPQAPAGHLRNAIVNMNHAWIIAMRPTRGHVEYRNDSLRHSARTRVERNLPPPTAH